MCNYLIICFCLSRQAFIYLFISLFCFQIGVLVFREPAGTLRGFFSESFHLEIFTCS